MLVLRLGNAEWTVLELERLDEQTWLVLCENEEQDAVLVVQTQVPPA